MFRGDARHSGVYATKGYNHFESVAWKFPTKGKIFSTPVVVNGIAYVGSGDNKLYAVDVKTGAQKWAFPTGRAVHSSPAVYNGVVYFTSYDGNCYAVDALTGREKWHFTTAGEIPIGGIGYWGMTPQDEFLADQWDNFISSPAIDPELDGGVIYFGSGKNMYAVNLKNHQLRWVFPTQGVVHTSPALAYGKVYFGSWDTNLYSLNASTGKQIWAAPTRDDVDYNFMKGIQASPMVHNNQVFLGARDGYFYAFNAHTGAKNWEKSLDGSWVVGSATVKDGIVYSNTSDYRHTVGFDESTGEIKFRFATRIYAFSSPIIAGKTMYLGNSAGSLFAVDLPSKGAQWEEYQTEGHLTNGPVWLNPDGTFNWGKFFEGKDWQSYQVNLESMEALYSLGSFISSPVIDGNMLYVGNADGHLYAFRLGKNKAPKVLLTTLLQEQVTPTPGPASVRLIAQAKDGRGSIRKVEFYLNSEKIGEASQKPYQMTWQPVGGGTYNLRALAIDNAGGMAFSDTVRVQVGGSEATQSLQVVVNATKEAGVSKENLSDETIASMGVFPNPFEGWFQVKFTLRTPGYTTITLTSKSGPVTVLLDKYLEAGTYNLPYDGTALSRDLYVCRVVSNGKTQVRKILKR
jgi:outer membrane protein assembly factor BamB